MEEPAIRLSLRSRAADGKETLAVQGFRRTAHVAAADQIRKHFRVEKFFLDELGQFVGNAILALRDDGCMRDGHSQRAPEQGDDRKPIGQSADHCCLSPCFYEPDGERWLKKKGANKYHGCQPQASQCFVLHSFECGFAIHVVLSGFDEVLLLRDDDFLGMFFYCLLFFLTYTVRMFTGLVPQWP